MTYRKMAKAKKLAMGVEVFDLEKGGKRVCFIEYGGTEEDEE